jgi:hypothetical protein
MLGILGIVIYLALFPLLVYGIHHAHRRLFIVRPQQKKGKKNDTRGLPKPLWGRITEKLRFSFRDKRPFALGKIQLGIPIRFLFMGIYLLGFICSLAGGFTKNFSLFGLAFFLFLVWVAFGVMSARPLLRARRKVTDKMFEIAKSTLNQSAEYAENPSAVITVLEWRDGNRPVKVRFNIPTHFSAESEENFLRQFNQVFGSDTTWVPYVDEQAGAKGWDYEEGFVWLREMPPLPRSAPFSEHYVLDPSVAWSFFPVGLGVEHGMELVNPNTGVKENVLGFDLSGIQSEVSKKMGTYLSDAITTSPMVLVAGATGGGKSMNVDTELVIFEDTDGE